MRIHRWSVVLVVLVLLVAGCNMDETFTPEVALNLSPSVTAASTQSEGSADPSTLATPVDNPIPQEDPGLPAAATNDNAGETVDQQLTATSEGGVTPQLPVTTEAPVPTESSILRQLTSDGCCVQPTWSADGIQVLYIDRPSAETPSGLWGVAVQGGEPQFITDRLGIYALDMQLRATLVNGATVIERVATGEQWTIPNDGRAVSFSSDGNWVAWTAGQFDPPFDTARRQVWVSRFDGSQAREVFSTVGGGFSGWFPDGRMLVNGRVEDSETEQAYWALTLEEGQDRPGLVELARGERLRDAQVSRDGNWLAYMVTFSQDPAQDGLWLVDTHSGERHKLDVFGSYQWRDGERLLVVPLDLGQPGHRVLQVQAATGEVQALTDPAVISFKIANGDWSVSPDGSKIVFRSAQDGNLWVLELPD